MDDGGRAAPDPLNGGQPTFGIDGGNFLLQLLRQSSQSSLLPSQSQLISHRHLDPAVAAMGPSLPFNFAPPPVDSTPILSSSPSVPFSPFPHPLLHHVNNQQRGPPPGFHQNFNLSSTGNDLGPNQGYPVGINVGIREDATVNLMAAACDQFQRNNQQFAPPTNQNFNIDLSTNQRYQIGTNGGVREMYNGNLKAYDLSQSINQNYIPFLDHHQRTDISTNQAYPNGYNGNMRTELRNQMVQDVRNVFDGMPQREREERRQQNPIQRPSPIHSQHVINQLPPLDHHQTFNNSYNSRDLGKLIYSNEGIESSFLDENIMRLHKFETLNLNNEVQVLHSNQNNSKFVASSSDNFSYDEGKDEDLLSEQLKQSLVVEDKSTLFASNNYPRKKDFRSDFSRGHHVSSQRVRLQRRNMQCRRDIDIFVPNFLSIYESLVPAKEEIAKHRKLISSLNKLISTEWPHARLYLYGSCANSFGAANSDIDVCLSINGTNLDKSEIILKLAEILEAGQLQNILALTRARVPIVKMMDPETGLSCDICVNNLLAIVNTKLLKDYAIIDPRLRQLAFIIKHWAKSRRVNETYQGTLSSYAYVIMCIHYLQNRRPAILPCLQGMEPTYFANVDNKEYAYYDKVENLCGLGARNRDSISRLVWGFFHYWAYQHDYASDVISVRTGSIISKHEKDWTRRVGNDRHLICIEDPFEITHDLGRVVDKYSIKILREEFERAANIMQYDPNPTVTLFEKYVQPPQNLHEDEFGDEDFEGSI